MQRVKNLTVDDLNIIVRTVDDGITLQGPRGELIYANDAAARIIGFPSAEELLTRPVAEVMSAFDILDEEGAILPPGSIPSRRALDGIKAEQLVRFRVRATGEERWSILKSTPSFDSDGRLKFAINIFQDVTERKRAEDALRVSHEWLSTTLASIGDAVIATDAKGQIRFLNAVAEQVTGWSSAEAHGQPLASVFRIIDEQTRRAVESPVAKVLREGSVVGLANHTLLVRRDGATLAIDDSAAPIRDSQGGIVGVVLVFRDVEQRRREEERLKFVHEAMSKLGSSLDHAVTLQAVARLAVPHIADWCAIDMQEDDGTITRLATAHVDPAKVALAEELARRYPTPPDAPQGVRAVLRTGKTEWARAIPDAVLVARTVDAEHLRIARELGLRAYIVAPMIARGRIMGAITFVAADQVRSFDERDVQLAEAVAERAAVALDNARLYREAEEATNLREQLLGVVSHDLRNPLGAIVMAASLLKRALTGQLELVKTVERIAVTADRMKRMIDQLLDFSRVRLGRGLPIEPQPMVLDELCRNVVDELQTAHPDKRIVIEAGEAIEGAWDADRLSEVVSNLVGNALQYGDARPVSLRLKRDGDEAVIEVHNHGEPIATSVMPHLFDPFRRGHHERKSDGAGLGLFIARWIVGAHQGRIEVVSLPERGTTFTVRLPARR
jgi:PAS domain S-box-containing protein